MINILFLMVSTAFFTCIVAGVLAVLFKRRIAINQRINNYFGETSPARQEAAVTLEKKKSKLAILWGIYWERGTQYLSHRVSKSERKKIDMMLQDAGHPFKSAVDFRLFQFVLSLGLSVPVIFFMIPLAENKGTAWLMVIVLAFLGFRFPIFYLGKKKTARIKEINKAMPDFFDTINILLEAGMGMDQAVSEVSQKLKGPLSEEFLRALEDMKLGKSRRDAFYDLRKRVPSDSFQSVITSLIQADHLGIGMAKVLGNLTARIREQRREAAREQAMKAPIKMLFPMVIFIFPSLFIVILGPMAITLITKGLGG